MKNFFAQIIFIAILLLATWSQACAANQTSNSNISDQQNEDKQLALSKLKAEKEGIQHFQDLIISTKCWTSMIESIGLDFAQQAAQEQLVETCPNSEASISGIQSQISREGIVTCVMIVVPQVGLRCE